jgi:hypothetical protein
MKYDIHIENEFPSCIPPPQDHHNSSDVALATSIPVVTLASFDKPVLTLRKGRMKEMMRISQSSNPYLPFKLPAYQSASV